MKKSVLYLLSVAFLIGCGPKTGSVIELPVPEREPGQTDVLGLTRPAMDTVHIGLVGLGARGSGAIERLFYAGGTIVALCDIDSARVSNANKKLQKLGVPAAQEYYGGTDAYKKMLEQENIDLVYICTTWDYHTPIAVAAMNAGKNAVIEVPAAMTIDQCWQLVNTAEKTRMHCMMLENCTYDRFETAVLNMVQKGVFGEVVHVEGAYDHDLRGYNFQKENGYWDMWRLRWNTNHTGDVYPTHGLGPIAQVLNIHRGDRMKYLTSMSTDQFGFTDWAHKTLEPTDSLYGREYKLGDVCNTLIRTEKGKTMLVQHDISNPRPYSRIHQVVGTKGFAQKYPVEEIAIEGDVEGTSLKGLSPHSPLDTAAYNELLRTYKHPFYVEMEEMANKVGGHGGMDFIMDWRLIYCLKHGLPLDMDVYDAAEWSSIVELSEISTTNNSATVAVPDFTRGAWNKLDGLHFAY